MTVPPPGVTHLLNLYCTFWGCEFSSEVPSIKEHLIARRFVPRGTLDKQWNLITRACDICNSKKGDLEDDISAISMQPDVGGVHADSDERLLLDSSRKGDKTISRASKRTVGESEVRLKVEGQVSPSVTAKFDFVGLNEVEPERMYRLAWYHFIGLFSFLTYDSEKKRGFFPPEECVFAPVLFSHKADWGNPILRQFSQTSQEWEHRLFCNTAEGFFKAVIRKAPLDQHLWSWAFEWNKNYRIVGLHGEKTAVQKVFDTMPDLQMKSLCKEIRFRMDENLPEGEDVLFREPDNLKWQDKSDNEPPELK